MSKVGQLTRGLKWSLQRKGDGTFPEGIAEDPAKMNDIAFYNSFIQTRDEKKVNSLLIYARNLQRSGLKGKPKYKQTIVALNSDEILDQEKIDALKPKQVDYSALTKDELKAELEKSEIAFSESATKAELLALLQGE